MEPSTASSSSSSSSSSPLLLLNADLLELVVSFLPTPDALLKCCRAGLQIRQSPAALSRWLLSQHGLSGCLFALIRAPCAKIWQESELCMVLQRLHAAGASLGSQPTLALAALHWAAVTLGSGRVLRLLIPGCGPLPRTLGILVDAAAKGRTEAVAELLKSVIAPREDLGLPLKATADQGHAGVISLLLTWKGGAGRISRSDQEEALFLAVRAGHTEAARALLDAGVDARSRFGLLHLAICDSSSNSRRNSSSSSSSSSMKPGPGNGYTSSGPGSSSTSAEDREPSELLILLLNAGAKDETGLALGTAATVGRLADLRLLIKMQPREAVAALPRASLGLQHALINGHLRVARELLMAGVPIDSFLLCARSRFANPEALNLIEEFLGNIRDRQLVDKQLVLSATDPSDAFMRRLLRWGANPTSWECQALRKAVLQNRLSCVQTILQAAGAAGLRRSMPCCVLRAAVQRGHIEIAEALMSAGLGPSASSRHCCLEPHLCAACMLCHSGSMAMTELLMRFGSAAHADEALRLVACGKMPSWRCEQTVQAVMDAMVDQRMQQQQEKHSRSSLELPMAQLRVADSCTCCGRQHQQEHSPPPHSCEPSFGHPSCMDSNLFWENQPLSSRPAPAAVMAPAAGAPAAAQPPAPLQPSVGVPGSRHGAAGSSSRRRRATAGPSAPREAVWSATDC